MDSDEPHASEQDPKRSMEHDPPRQTPDMTTPRVIELPRRLEPTSADTFLSGCEVDLRPLAVVLPLRGRDTVPGRRPPHSRRGPRPTRPSGDPGPGGDAA